MEYNTYHGFTCQVPKFLSAYGADVVEGHTRSGNSFYSSDAETGGHGLKVQKCVCGGGGGGHSMVWAPTFQCRVTLYKYDTAELSDKITNFSKNFPEKVNLPPPPLSPLHTSL